MIGDFEDQVINDIYNYSSDYRQESIHIAVFPLEHSSVILVFAEQGKNRYRKFFKQFKKLSPDDQLAAINYILFAYTENIFLSPQIYDIVHENQAFMDACKIVTDVHVNTPGWNRQFDRASPTPLPLKSYTLSAGPTPSV